MVKPSPPEITKLFEQEADEMRSTPGTRPEKSTEITPQPHRLYDEMDMNHNMQLDADTSVEQLHPTPINPRSSKYDSRYKPKPKCNDDYRY